MAIVNIDSIIAGFSDTKRQKLEFIFKEPLRQDGNLFAPAGLIVSVDCTTTEAYKLTANITQNPIETGTTLSDHIHIRPETLSISGIITDKPLEILTALAQVPVRALLSTTARGLLGKYLGGYEKHLAIAGTGLINEKIIAPLLGTRATRRDVARLYWNNVLKSRFNSKKPFTIRSEVGIIENCFFQSITWDRKRSHGDSLFFQATIQEIQTVASDVTLLPNAPEAQKTTRLGKRGGNIIEGIGEEATSRIATQIKSASRQFKHTYSAPNFLSRTINGSQTLLSKRFRKIYNFNIDTA